MLRRIDQTKAPLIDFNQSLQGFAAINMAPIGADEYAARIAKLQNAMDENGIGAVWLDASSSLNYFFGHALGLSERIHGALIPAKGAPCHISPTFEEPKLRELLRDKDASVATWEEDEDPYALIAAEVTRMAGENAILALDGRTPWAFAAPIARAMAGRITEAHPLISPIRQIKSDAEIALIQAAMSASFEVHKAVYAGLYEGISTAEVCAFINAAHLAFGLTPLFAAAQFGEATAYPHGVPYTQNLKAGDMVLIDMGATLHGYPSDITRSYVFGSASPRQRMLWNHERDAHQAGFAAANLGVTCETVDLAARKSLEDAGFGPGYAVPGLPHRTGHGLGLDNHEEPYIVKGNQTILQPGMCFSIEPMLCLYGECGIRLEDIIYMTKDGPRSFCPPALSLDAPFA